MDLVVGGAYQGKLHWAMKEYNIAQEEVFDCAGGISADEPQRCLFHMEEFCWWCIRCGLDPIEEIQKKEPMWRDAVIVCRDIGQGVVPMDHAQRIWREANGRMVSWLAARANRVTRVLCGLPQVLK